MQKRFAMSLLVLLCFAAILAGCGKANEADLKEVSAEQIIKQEERAFGQIKNIMQEAAQSYGDYLSFDITEKDFRTLVIGYRDRMGRINDDLTQYYETHAPIGEPPDHITLAILSAMSARQAISDLFQETLTADGVLSRDKTVVVYAEKMKAIEKAMSTFRTILAFQYDSMSKK